MIVKNSDDAHYWQLIKEIGSYNDKWADNVATKVDIINRLIQSLNINAKTILFPAFNPIAIALADNFNYQITMVCSKELTNIFDLNKITIIDNLDNLSKFDIVLALDEYFTYGNSEQEQRDSVEQLGKLTDGWLITTLQDYKNFAPHKKNQIDTMVVNSYNNYVILENSVADKTDKQVWNHYWYCIKDHINLLTIGPIARRTMYFKQLAKYTSDVGSKQYVVQKNVLYKGFFSRNFEHIITVNF
jgi:hypothetical protein